MDPLQIYVGKYFLQQILQNIIKSTVKNQRENSLQKKTIS